MITLTSGLSYLDLHFQGLPHIIATGVLHGAGGVALVDPGPSSTLPTLRSALEQAGLALGDVTAILLTHVHLDHAGSVGTLSRALPRLRVHVHERGAPHLVNPEKLLASATRLYGDAMERLWGEVAPVAPSAISVLRGGERLSIGGRTLDVAYTPGHASHHVSFLDRDVGVAFTGDTAGVKLSATGVALPPTPPPDIDLDAWQSSLEQFGRWRPDTFFLTHFGPSPATGHLDDLKEHLQMTSRLARASLAREGTDEDREAWFAEQVRTELQRRMTEQDARAYELAARLDLNWRGLARYWRKRG